VKPLFAAALFFALLALAAACRSAEETPPSQTPTATAMPTATPTPTPTPTPPPATTVSQEGRYLLEIATGDLLQVPGLVWSPDGKHVAGVGCCIAEGGLDIYNLGTGRTSRIYEGDVVGLAWSPDSQRIAFSPYGRRADGLIGATSLAVVNLDGSDLETPAEHPGAGVRSWSPDGRFIAFTDHKFTSSALRIEDDVYLLDLSTGKTIKISESVGPAYFISLVTWSPDSSYLAIAGDYRLSEDGSFRSLVYLYSLASGSVMQLGESHTTMAAAAWAPGGKSLAAVDDTGLTLYYPGTDSKRRLADAPTSEPVLWSPDGSWIAFRFGKPQPFIGYENKEIQPFYLAASDGSAEPRALPPARSPSFSRMAGGLPTSAKDASAASGTSTGPAWLPGA